jgi:SagB-type dehydrogenase family enzyme
MVDIPSNSHKRQFSDTKRALLSAWLGEPEPIALVLTSDLDERDQPFPLTSVQQAYWIGRSRAFALNVTPASYVELECDGFDLPRFEHAMARLIERHEMLRAVVLPDGRQRILPSVPPLRVEEIDLRNVVPNQAEIELTAIRGRLLRSLGRADCWPLFGVSVSRLDDQRTRLHIAFDILIVDVQSVRILTRDLALFYHDQAAALPIIAVSFRDLALADRSQRSGADYERARKYWFERLDHLPLPPRLPLARSPDSIGTPRFVRHYGHLPARYWNVLKERAVNAKLTPTAILLTAFSEIVARHAASSRFTLNLTLYNRPPVHPQVNEIVGDFTRLILFEVDLVSSESFEEQAGRLQKRLWTDLEHQSFDGVDVIRERMRRLRSRESFMPVVFTSNLHGQANMFDDTQALGRVVASLTQTPQVWIDHQVAEHDGDLVYNWDVVEELFPPGLVDSMLADYQRRIAELASDRNAFSRASSIGLPMAASAEGSREARDDGVLWNPSFIIDRVRARVAMSIGHESVELDANLLELGITSIGIVTIANALEDEFGARPDLELLFERRTVGAVSDLYIALLIGPSAPVTEPPARSATALILDPEERRHFKEREPGLRQDLDLQTAIRLPHLAGTDAIIANLVERRSHRHFSLKPVALEALATLLGTLRRGELEGQPKYAYASAGGLYAVQIYLYVQPGRVTGIPAGTYYYHPALNALVTLNSGARLERNIHAWMNRPIFDEAAFSLFLVADEQAMEPMYGRLTHDFCLYEAGSIGQLAMMVAPQCGLGLCGIGRVNLAESRHLFEWNPSHRVLHTLLGGIVRSESSTGRRIDDLKEEVERLTSDDVETLLEARRSAGSRSGSR